MIKYDKIRKKKKKLFLLVIFTTCLISIWNCYKRDILEDIMTKIDRFNHKLDLKRDRLDTKSRATSMEKAEMHDTSCYVSKSRYWRTWRFRNSGSTEQIYDINQYKKQLLEKLLLLYWGSYWISTIPYFSYIPKVLQLVLSVPRN